SWAMFRLVRAAALAGQGEPAKKVADAIPDAALRGRAQFELLRAQLQRSRQNADDKADEEVDTQTPANGLARECIARHNARRGSTNPKAIESWPDKLKPFGYAGIALD